jgi:6-phosphogluconate dehydrogenase (decarboxylating)
MSAVDQNSTTDGGCKLGFIGLGYMGSRIGKRLVDAGYPLVVFNRNRVKAEGIARLSVESSGSGITHFKMPFSFSQDLTYKGRQHPAL